MSTVECIQIPHRGVGSVNVWLLGGDPLTLIDTGPRNDEALAFLERSLRERGVRLEDIDLVIGTHHHLDHVAALVTILRDLYDLDEQEVMRNRVLVSEQFLVGIHRDSPREEEARQLARARMRDLEFAWATFLSRAMEHGAIPEADARLLTRAVLGLHNSVWHWYRPRGPIPLHEVGDFYVRRCLAVVGLPPEAANEVAAPAPKSPKRAQARAAAR